MKTWTSFNERPSGNAGSVVTLGNFDGMHLGHQQLMSRLFEWRDALGLPAVVVTFDPHPAEYLKPQAKRRVLVPLQDRRRIFEGMGLDELVVLPFNEQLRQLPAEEFFHSFLGDALNAKHVVLGPDSRFGRGRQGDFDLCKQLGEARDIGCDRAEPIEVLGRRVSSSLIRGLVEEGDVAQIPSYLGRFYRVRGRVVPGKARGRALGFPTANVACEGTLKPADGVYGGRLWFAGRAHAAAISVGSTPTFGEGETLVEAHVLDFEGDLYGGTVSVEFQRRLRGQRRFESADALVEQMRCDVAIVRADVAKPRRS